MILKQLTFFLVLTILPLCYNLPLSNDSVLNYSTASDEAKRIFRKASKINFDLADGQKTDIIYTLFTDSLDTAGKVVTTESAKEDIKNKTIPTVLLIHGFTTDDTSPWFNPLKNEYFKHGLHNIIYINWSKAGNKSWPVSAANVRPIGKYIAEFLIASKVDLRKTQIVGHSLGSQLASFIGKFITQLTGQKIGRITGLDPAGPGFSNAEMKEDERLNPNDAYFVDNIHTDVQLFGFSAPLGHVDFYPNQGGHQPGCPLRQEDSNCSHARSTLYFIESFSTEKYATESDYFENNFDVKVIPRDQCCAKNIIFGQHTNVNARGVFSFQTNARRPFLS